MQETASTPRIVEIRQNILKKNDLLAARLRKRFHQAGVYVVNLVSSPGAGKTTFLTEVLSRLAERYKVAALVGDLATDHDAERLRQSGARVKQITTGTVCHLEAEMIERSLEDWDLSDIDFLFIENVGNLVCPAGYDLGENRRVVLFSVTEGEDKPMKYPTIVNSADESIITKMDMAELAGFQRDRFYDSIYKVRPGISVYEVSARTGEGIGEWISRLEAEKRAFQQRAGTL
ncbi:hydrogenase nickel incorporation protein HypB [Thermicanus aegyptius]|uniref:hydrogenase nickel incorporation protein HypB n=1 Tax=Thermicanus aegyptius TaxID=94009 RepID=UPI00048FF796|nr:hydrogenase nickel incorporation protein HypB [Thermicanus aegyptius]